MSREEIQNEVVSVMEGMASTSPDAEPNESYAWHLFGEEGINVEAAWELYSGQGVLISFMDNGFDYEDLDLAPGYRADLSYDHATGGTDINPGSGTLWHGTMTSQVAVGALNGYGGQGVAYEAEWSGQRVAFGSSSAGLEDAFAAGAMNSDVFNNSWSFTDPYGGSYESPYYQTYYGDVVDQATAEGRGGLGTIIVVSAGNDGSMEGANVPTISLKADPGTIVVGNYDGTGEVYYNSEYGANVLVSAPGTGIPVQNGDETRFATGTSFSAPVVSGVAALMLEANSDLGWRDVQDIFALSSRMIDSGHDSWETNGASTWNGGGLTFSNYYGFGAVDAAAATSLARTWLDVGTSGTQDSASASYTPSSRQTGSSFTVSVSDEIEIQQVLISMDWVSSSWDDVVLKLTSPEGTKSILVEGRSYGSSVMTYEYSSNAFWSESSAGLWTISVVHQDTGEALDVGVNSIGLEFLGDDASDDDQYFFTDDFAELVAGDPTRGELSDSAGDRDILNSAASSRNNVIDIRDGSASSVGGGELTVHGIEHVISGVGDDSISGNEGANTVFSDYGADTVNGNGGDDYLVTGAGDDVIHGGTGDDRIVAQSGNDTVFGGEGADTLFGGDGEDWIGGDDGDDLIFSWFNSDSVAGGAGDDTIYAGHGNDTILGDEGSDRIWGEAGNDWLSGGDGADSLSGGQGDDILFGGADNDRLDGGSGADTMSGGAGDDVYIIDDVDDVVIEEEGAGNDAAYYVASGDFRVSTSDPAGSVFRISDNVETGRLMENVGASDLHGGAGDNSVWGNSSDNVLSGGAGHDTLCGGDGSDVFMFRDTSDAYDTVVDFQTGQDLIDISAIMAPDIADPWDSGSLILSQDGSDVRVSISEDAYAGDAPGDHLVAILSGVELSALGADDFVL
ncbi:S8 family serine peptidase [Salipiger sp. PrR003]|uniref:S8 family serine peptidase n=1 Tax=Salipiger sp. PrR003 TaxID=2706776 RepID=UPI0013DA37D7|nr:S8 family serine peptidase [Salipiger sp. PrR003]NDV50644.1 S8 family serine peptidase [Salipiger sp. PrR003]